MTRANLARLIDLLLRIEAHHVALNSKAGRHEEHSHTLRLVRSALALTRDAK